MPAWSAVVVASLDRRCGSGGDATRPKGSLGSRIAAVDHTERPVKKSYHLDPRQMNRQGAAFVSRRAARALRSAGAFASLSAWPAASTCSASSSPD
jgi:hypothetical protein